MRLPIFPTFTGNPAGRNLDLVRTRTSGALVQWKVSALSTPTSKAHMETERERERHRQIHTYLYMYVYIYIHTPVIVIVVHMRVHVAKTYLSM